MTNNQTQHGDVLSTQEALLRDTHAATYKPTSQLGYGGSSVATAHTRGRSDSSVKQYSEAERGGSMRNSNNQSGQVPTVQVPTISVGAYVGTRGLQEAVKRSIDILGATILLILSAPLLALCYLLIRFDSEGPAVYDGKRVGRGGRSFKCLKFRTMHVDADQRLQTLLNNDTKMRQEYSVYRKLENDPRVTRIGALLRRTSLDELPQLLNVLRGDMSLVGPRPYLVSERRAMGESRRVILRVKPGLTGYWQVSGRSTVSFAERLDMEERYARQWSLGWDIKLLFKTVLVVVKAKGAS